jgi:hypothetical protein
VTQFAGAASAAIEPSLSSSRALIPYGHDQNDHRPGVPAGLEDLIAGLGEVEQLFGDTARAVFPPCGAAQRAMAARDRAIQ